MPEPDYDEMRKEWTADRFYDEWNSRVRLKASLVGSLYPPIVQREIDLIITACTETFGTSPEGLLANGHVKATIRDDKGLVHHYWRRNLCSVESRESFERPGQLVTCLRCVGGRR